jgi:hypothetical protein
MLINQLDQVDYASTPINMIVAKESTLMGSFCFHGEFADAIQIINPKSWIAICFTLVFLTWRRPLAPFQVAGHRTDTPGYNYCFNNS